MITHNFVKKWCEELINAWKGCDIPKIIEIFSETRTYFEDPFSVPGRNHDEIRTFWEEIDQQDIQTLTMTPIAIEQNRAIVRWYLDYLDVNTKEHYVMDGIYQVDFDENSKCINFVQWWVMKE